MFCSSEDGHLEEKGEDIGYMASTLNLQKSFGRSTG
jgi:hypothetical protein